MQISRTTAFIGGITATLVLGAGTAVATVGPSLVLGKATTTKAVTTLTSRTGTPLALNPKKGYPPLRVGSDVTVKNLDADELDGKDSSAFLSASGTAADASALGGQPPSAYLPAGGTAADAKRLGGLDPSSYGTTVYGASTSPSGVLLVSGQTLDTVEAPAGTYLVQLSTTLTNPYEAPADFECDVELGHVGTHDVDTVAFSGTSVAAAAPDESTLGSVSLSQVVSSAVPITLFSDCLSTSGNDTQLAKVAYSSLTATRLQTFVGSVPILPNAS